MSRPAVAASQSVPFELVFDDGIPMDDFRHPIQLEILRQTTQQAMRARGRKDYTVAGNNFVYYSLEQAEDVVKGRPYFRGPDFFFVDGIPAREDRKGWVSWEEGGRLPDLILEMLSPSTAHIDRKDKRDLYARVFRTREYYLLDMDKEELEGLRLVGDVYRPMRPTAEGRLRSEVLDLDLGFWRGDYVDNQGTWVRLFYPDGRMVPTTNEQAEAECQRADAEHQRAEAERRQAEAERRRAEAAEAELARLRALLDQG